MAENYSHHKIDRLAERAKKAAKAIYLVADKVVADDVSAILVAQINEVARLKDQGRHACELFDEVKRLQVVVARLTKALERIDNGQEYGTLTREQSFQHWAREALAKEGE